MFNGCMVNIHHIFVMFFFLPPHTTAVGGLGVEQLVVSWRGWWWTGNVLHHLLTVVSLPLSLPHLAVRLCSGGARSGRLFASPACLS